MATASQGSIGAGAFLKRMLLGRALASHRAEHQLLPKILALPVFASDALSSTAYATEEMMLVLVAAGAGALAFKIPIGIAIAAVLAIVITSYRQTVRAYPRGGGSYIVARENLGTIPGLVAAAAILTDYVLTVAVSMTAGTVAITSAFPAFAPHKVLIAICLVLLITLVNLRGVKEAGTLFAFPTYGFVAMIGLTLIVGFARCLNGCPVAVTSALPIRTTAGLGVFLVLRAFASGATALTGVEAVADGVQAFRRPQSRNAAATLAIMGGLLISMFLGITVLAELLKVRVDADIASTKSVLAQVGETVFGHGAAFYVLQILTAGILILAANTSFQDFPRLSSILARDRFMPSQFRNRGDRLVFSNGVVVLAALACFLIYAYHAELTRLIQLYVVGVFTAFTLSQAGMVRRWQRVRGEGWRRRAVVNAIGATATAIVLVIVTVTKFRFGAWIVVTAMPLIVLLFLAINRHYRRVGELLRLRRLSGAERATNTFVVLVSDVGRACNEAIAYLRSVRPEHVVPLWAGAAGGFERAAERWRNAAPRMGELERLPGADEHVVKTIRSYVRGLRREPESFVTVVIPELLTDHSWWQFVRHRAALLLKTSLLFEPGVVVTDVPAQPGGTLGSSDAPAPLEHYRSVVLIPVSAVHDATIRAITYARSLQPAEIEAFCFVTDPEQLEQVVGGWHERELDVPLVLVEAPFRDLGAPLLEEVRRHTARGDTIVTVVLPEFIPARWWENLLHNQTAFYFKRLLLFEPGVVVTSVPFHLRAPEVSTS